MTLRHTEECQTCRGKIVLLITFILLLRKGDVMKAIAFCKCHYTICVCSADLRLLKNIIKNVLLTILINGSAKPKRFSDNINTSQILLVFTLNHHDSIANVL